MRTKFLLASSIQQELIVGVKYRCWAHFMFSKVGEYFTPYFTVEEPRTQVRCPPTYYVYSCRETLVTRGTLGYVSYQKGVIQGHPDHRCPTREALGLCPRIMLPVVLLLDVSSQTVFPYHISLKYILRDNI